VIIESGVSIPRIMMEHLYIWMPHHKFSRWQSNNENCVKFIHSWVYTFCTWISCVENMFDTWINVSIDEVWTNKWTNVT
jgi:hypothetical protein